MEGRGEGLYSGDGCIMIFITTSPNLELDLLIINLHRPDLEVNTYIQTDSQTDRQTDRQTACKGIAHTAQCMRYAPHTSSTFSGILGHFWRAPDVPICTPPDS